MSAAKTESPEKIAKCAEVGRRARRRHDEMAQRFAEVFNARLHAIRAAEDDPASGVDNASAMSARKDLPSSR